MELTDKRYDEINDMFDNPDLIISDYISREGNHIEGYVSIQLASITKNEVEEYINIYDEKLARIIWERINVLLDRYDQFYEGVNLQSYQIKEGKNGIIITRHFSKWYSKEEMKLNRFA